MTLRVQFLLRGLILKRVKNKLKAVIFDMDGTIIKTEHLWEQATRDLLSDRGFTDLSNDQLEVLASLSGTGLEKSSEILKKEFKLFYSVNTITQDTKRAAHKLFESQLEFIDGFEIFHSKLYKHLISTGLASNADLLSLQLLSKKMNFHKFFGKHIYSIESIGNIAKPKPDIFLHAADQLKVKPHECIVFEDSLAGFQAANAAGMRCVAIKNKTNKKNLELVCKAIESYHEAEKTLIEIHLTDAT